MDAKIQKEFTLVVGSNDKVVTEETLIKAAMELEGLGNSTFNVRFHISVKEE